MSNSEDYASWRNMTATGIRYRFLGTEGRFTAEEGQILWRGIFRAEDVSDFLLEIFPPALIFGNTSIPDSATMPGLPTMVAKDVSYTTLDGADMPIDVFNADPSATGGTYHGYVNIEVTFGPSNAPSGNPNDPRTFLEISSNVGGDYIYAPPAGAKVQDETSTAGENDEVEGAALDADTLRVRGTAIPETPRPNRNPQMAMTVLVPTIEWNILWKQVPFNTFRNTIVWRLRSLNGRVNSVYLPWLMNADPETVLFAGFSYKESYTWRNGQVNTPPIDITIKLIEKRIVWKGIICGHNHAFEPGKGWVRTLLQDGSSPYRKLNFNLAFKI